MYGLRDYARMIADQGRMGPYVRALEAVVRPGSVVVDIGTGTGILALVACCLGARRVYAVDTNYALEVGRELARENGFADRIVFLARDVREVELPERADVIVSDLRGALPLYADHLATIADVRSRLLKPTGVLIPMSDKLLVAVAEAQDLYDWALGAERGPLGLSLHALRSRLTNTAVGDLRTRPLQAENVISVPAIWGMLDYSTVQPTPVHGHAELAIRRRGTGHGLAVWFDAVLAGEHGFSCAPGLDVRCYSPLFLPWPHAVPLTVGDTVIVDVWAQAGGEPWGWNSSVPTGPTSRESFKQSSFLAYATGPTLRTHHDRESTLSHTTQN